MRILVCGGRNYNDKEKLFLCLDHIFQDEQKKNPAKDYPITCVITGGARGADTLAYQWARDNAVPAKVYPAKWEILGKKAGILRNVQMLEEGKPDLVVAFLGGRGTAHMVRIAREAGVEVREIS